MSCKALLVSIICLGPPNSLLYGAAAVDCGLDSCLALPVKSLLGVWSSGRHPPLVYPCCSADQSLIKELTPSLSLKAIKLAP